MLSAMTYPSDLNDAEWQRIHPLLPPDKPVGKPREVDLRAILDAIFYRADNGIKWRALPVDFPNIALWAFKKGRPSMATIAFGSGSMFGNASTIRWLNRCAWMLDDRLNPVSVYAILSL
jgi:transposase